jgi:hypothetical protein
MYRPPFHRRIVPWIFAIVFIVAAPTLVFYTAGYRWNAKKDKIERNGTLILDSTPDKARIFLNDRDTQETTPITLQNVTPGRYLVRMTRDGYHDWQKRLDVYPEFVTFANTIQLWRNATPNFFKTEPLIVAETSPNGSLVAGTINVASSTRLAIWEVDGTEQSSFDFSQLLSPQTEIKWSSDSRALIIQDETTTGTNAWFINVRSNVGPTILPRGLYVWDGSSVRGISERSRIAINLEDGSFTRTNLLPGTYDRYSDLVLRDATGTDALVLFHDTEPLRGLVLPPGNWSFVSVVDKQIVLRDGNEWISLDPDEDAPTVRRVQGDRLRPYTTRQKTIYLLVNGGELWSWDPSNEPELLLRQSEPIVEALWHPDGRSVIFATKTSVSALDMDTRDGRLQTTLATVSDLTDMLLIDNRLLLSATREDRTASWSLDIE